MTRHHMRSRVSAPLVTYPEVHSRARQTAPTTCSRLNHLPRYLHYILNFSKQLLSLTAIRCEFLHKPGQGPGAKVPPPFIDHRCPRIHILADSASFFMEKSLISNLSNIMSSSCTFQLQTQDKACRAAAFRPSLPTHRSQLQH